uniref:Uncharacterized protein n=1 Tax=Chromera velia CCMP2878 TaxID=1169474 RepID=A0A0G4IB84_9ALVE|eukprot:Cvel_12769.t1-p1 / transcript=Cvel_12769.t1 / gene=Cvel_12769 / organism=Chromera_velia_CCMP2878 / gene_product=hypothetical protein / transcript_product=hypothetical protein / location=Cvel_scaffold849:49535-57430(+) / protein_length=1777 / sequence_SO=supercontig / SO=protein_coding / is_pseudo=false
MMLPVAGSSPPSAGASGSQMSSTSRSQHSTSPSVSVSASSPSVPSVVDRRSSSAVLHSGTGTACHLGASPRSTPRTAPTTLVSTTGRGSASASVSATTSRTRTATGVSVGGRGSTGRSAASGVRKTAAGSPVFASSPIHFRQPSPLSPPGFRRRILTPADHHLAAQVDVLGRLRSPRSAASSRSPSPSRRADSRAGSRGRKQTPSQHGGMSSRSPSTRRSRAERGKKNKKKKDTQKGGKDSRGGGESSVSPSARRGLITPTSPSSPLFMPPGETNPLLLNGDGNRDGEAPQSPTPEAARRRRMLERTAETLFEVSQWVCASLGSSGVDEGWESPPRKSKQQTNPLDEADESSFVAAVVAVFRGGKGRTVIPSLTEASWLRWLCSLRYNAREASRRQQQQQQRDAMSVCVPSTLSRTFVKEKKETDSTSGEGDDAPRFGSGQSGVMMRKGRKDGSNAVKDESSTNFEARSIALQVVAEDLQGQVERQREEIRALKAETERLRSAAWRLEGSGGTQGVITEKKESQSSREDPQCPYGGRSPTKKLQDPLAHPFSDGASLPSSFLPSGVSSFHHPSALSLPPPAAHTHAHVDECVNMRSSAKTSKSVENARAAARQQQRLRYVETLQTQLKEVRKQLAEYAHVFALKKGTGGAPPPQAAAGGNHQTQPVVASSPSQALGGRGLRKSASAEATAGQTETEICNSPMGALRRFNSQPGAFPEAERREKKNVSVSSLKRTVLPPLSNHQPVGDTGAVVTRAVPGLPADPSCVSGSGIGSGEVGVRGTSFGDMRLVDELQRCRRKLREFERRREETDRQWGRVEEEKLFLQSQVALLQGRGDKAQARYREGLKAADEQMLRVAKEASEVCGVPERSNADSEGGAAGGGVGAADGGPAESAAEAARERRGGASAFLTKRLEALTAEKSALQLQLADHQAKCDRLASEAEKEKFRREVAEKVYAEAESSRCELEGLKREGSIGRLEAWQRALWEAQEEIALLEREVGAQSEQIVRLTSFGSGCNGIDKDGAFDALARELKRYRDSLSDVEAQTADLSHRLRETDGRLSEERRKGAALKEKLRSALKLRDSFLELVKKTGGAPEGLVTGSPPRSPPSKHTYAFLQSGTSHTHSPTRANKEASEGHDVSGTPEADSSPPPSPSKRVRFVLDQAAAAEGREEVGDKEEKQNGWGGCSDAMEKTIRPGGMSRSNSPPLPLESGVDRDEAPLPSDSEAIFFDSSLDDLGDPLQLPTATGTTTGSAALEGEGGKRLVVEGGRQRQSRRASRRAERLEAVRAHRSFVLDRLREKRDRHERSPEGRQGTPPPAEVLFLEDDQEKRGEGKGSRSEDIPGFATDTNFPPPSPTKPLKSALRSPPKQKQSVSSPSSPPPTGVDENSQKVPHAKENNQGGSPPPALPESGGDDADLLASVLSRLNGGGSSGETETELFGGAWQRQRERQLLLPESRNPSDLWPASRQPLGFPCDDGRASRDGGLGGSLVSLSGGRAAKPQSHVRRSWVGDLSRSSGSFSVGPPRSLPPTFLFPSAQGEEHGEFHRGGGREGSGGLLPFPLPSPQSPQPLCERTLSFDDSASEHTQAPAEKDRDRQKEGHLRENLHQPLPPKPQLQFPHALDPYEPYEDFPAVSQFPFPSEPISIQNFNRRPNSSGTPPNGTKVEYRPFTRPLPDGNLVTHSQQTHPVSPPSGTSPPRSISGDPNPSTGVSEECEMDSDGTRRWRTILPSSLSAMRKDDLAREAEANRVRAAGGRSREVNSAGAFFQADEEPYEAEELN